ncbi:hypothetical protein [Kitasatospora sp. McL0602]|uniref:hypothetical protein n=1 Tax=Kitasatospora sp. McL0602 TaxID=3439530 RepID=UPI003F887C73
MNRSLALLLTAAAGAEAALVLVGGTAPAALGAAVLTATALVTARYVSGFASQDSGIRLPMRMLHARQAGLGDWQRAVEDGLTGRGDHGESLVRRLQRIYAARLAERHAVSLYDQPEAAAALVGPEVWSLIDPRGTPPRPVPQRTLRAAVDGLRTL